MAYGYTGKILVADLTSGTVTVDEHDDAWYRKYMGGATMAMDYILRGVPPQADPLGPENILVFAGGPLTGTAISGQSRMSVNCKSPLSGLIGDAQVGGCLPAEKMAGFDAVVVKGRSPSRWCGLRWSPTRSTHRSIRRLSASSSTGQPGSSTARTISPTR